MLTFFFPFFFSSFKVAPQHDYSKNTLQAIDSMRAIGHKAPEDLNATDAELEERKIASIAQLEAQRNAPNARVVSHDDNDDEMAQIQRDRLAALQVLTSCCFCRFVFVF